MGLAVGVVASLLAVTIQALFAHQVAAFRRWVRQKSAVRTELKGIEVNQLLKDVGNVRKTGNKARVPTDFSKESKEYDAVRVKWSTTPGAARALWKYHDSEANYLWPADDRPSKFRAGFHYRLASAAAKTADEVEESASLAHYAGHRFRELGEMRKAADDYKRSAELYTTFGDRGEAIKSAKRAVACYLAIAESKRAQDLSGQYGI